MKRICFIWILILWGIIFGCARIGAPTGGDKDQTPPKLVKAIPAERSTHFKGNKIVLYFDEYVTLKDIQKQLIISPPMRYTPEFIPSGGISKKIEIRIKDTLPANTTYVFNFGNSIKDNNEGNTLSFFQYVFSTGETIDSLSVEGSVRDAINFETDHFVSVMLYKKDSLYNDSIVYHQKPTYITNTLDSATAFRIPFVKEGTYALIALKDANNNYIFNPDKDKIGFINHFITIPTDSSYSISLFSENPKYKVFRPVQTNQNRIVFPYTGADSLPNIRVISKTPENFSFTTQPNSEKDSIAFWYAPQIQDSAVFVVSHQQQKDTFRLKVKPLKPKYLKIQPKSLYIHPQQTIELMSNIPIKSVDSSLIFIHRKDSLPVKFQAKLNHQNSNIQLVFAVDYNQTYNVKVLPKAIVDFFENTSDTLQFKIQSKSKESYSTLNLKLHSDRIAFPILLQITDLKGSKIIQEQFFSTTQPIFSFENIPPGKYRLRIIEDSNKNHKWDTGNYLQHIQPEKVIYIPKELDLRANWEITEDFTY